MADQSLAADASAAELARFWAKVSMPRLSQTAGCWEWTGAHKEEGYGMFRLATGTVVAAHRHSWMMAHGEISGGLHVCHHCDNPKCVRPSHLFLGTNAENIADRERKGRGKRQSGPAHHSYKVTPEMARSILSHIGAGGRQRDVAKAHGVSQPTVQRVIRQHEHAD